MKWKMFIDKGIFQSNTNVWGKTYNEQEAKKSHSLKKMHREKKKSPMHEMANKPRAPEWNAVWEEKKMPLRASSEMMHIIIALPPCAFMGILFVYFPYFSSPSPLFSKKARKSIWKLLSNSFQVFSIFYTMPIFFT